MLLAAVLADCSDDKTEIEQIIIEQPNSFTLTFSDESELTYEIEANDKIGINGGAYPVLYNGCVSLYDVPAEAQYLIYYPSDAAFSEGNILEFALPAAQEYVEGGIDPAACPLYCLTDNEGLDNMAMNTVCGGLKLTVPANESFSAVTSASIASETDTLTGDLQVNAATGRVTVLSENASKSLAVKGDIDISAGQELLMALPPLTFSGVLNVKLTSLKGIGTCSIDLTGKRIESGKLLSVELDNIEWLAKTDYYGKANCVLVAPGATSVTVDCAPYYTTSLLYAYENYPNDDDDQLPRSAKMLWNDVSTDFVGDITLAADGKSFTAQLNGQPGNALIAIYDKEDPDAEDAAILWSFHIWVTETNDVLLGTNARGNTYTVLDRNLGAVSVTPGDWRAIGMLYQWGRKDPFVSTGKIGENSNVTIYNHEGTVSMETVSGGKTTGTVEYAVMNPTKFIKYSRSKSNTSTVPYYYAYDWLYYANDALWGNSEGYNDPVFTTLRKSIYDPSPEGYMVAPQDTWLKATEGTDQAASVLADAIWDDTNKGYKLEQEGEQGWWYPIGGWRGRKDGKLTTVDTNGYYWYSTVESEKSSNAKFMNINASGIKLNGTNCRANSCSVRCVKNAY